MSYAQLIALLEAITPLVATVDPKTAATVSEIQALESLAAQLVTTLTTQSGASIDTVIATLRPEDPNPDNG